jgi:hypothetical protein
VLDCLLEVLCSRAYVSVVLLQVGDLQPLHWFRYWVVRIRLGMHDVTFFLMTTLFFKWLRNLSILLLHLLFFLFLIFFFNLNIFHLYSLFFNLYVFCLSDFWFSYLILGL